MTKGLNKWNFYSWTDSWKRGVSKQAIYKQIQSHKAELEGHTNKIQGKLWYDEVAVKILEDAAMNSAPSVVLTAEKEEVEQLKEKNKGAWSWTWCR